MVRRLPPAGRVAGLVTDGGGEAGILRVEPCVDASVPCLHDGIGVDWVRVPGGGGKRVRQNRKTPAHQVRKKFSGLNLAFVYGRD